MHVTDVTFTTMCQVSLNHPIVYPGFQIFAPPATVEPDSEHQVQFNLVEIVFVDVGQS